MKKPISIFKTKRFLLITIPISSLFTVLGFVLGFIFAPTKYEAHTILFSEKDLGNKTMGTITGLASSDIIIKNTYEQLTKKDFRHANGSVITSNEIVGGIRTWYTNTSDNMDFFYKSTDKSIVCEVANTLVSELIKYLDETNVHVSGYLKISSFAESPYQLPVTNKIGYFVGGPVLGVAFSFIVYAVFSKDFYAKADIEDGDFSYFEVGL